MRNVLSALILAVIITASARAQSNNSLVGTWTLVSVSSSRPSGERNPAPYGAHPSGILIYTRDGTMSVIISYSDRTLLSVADRVTAPAAERAEAFATSFAYSGRYSVGGDKVIHHVEVASVQNWVNTDQIRLVKFNGDKITLTTPPKVLNGREETFELVWQRVK